MKEALRLTVFGVFTNAFLFLIKIFVGIFSGSIALLSDAFNSLVDVMSSVVIYYAVKISRKEADVDHPFGHHQAEPIAGLFIAILAAVLAVEIVREIIHKLSDGGIVNITSAVYTVLIVTIIVKIILAYTFLKKAKSHHSPALKASGIDSRNDVFVSLVAIVGVTFSYFGMVWVEYVAAFGIAGVIARSGYLIAKENVDYLMGSSLPDDFRDTVCKAIDTVKGVKGHSPIKAQYVGNFINIQTHVFVDKDMSIKDAYKIRKKVQHRLQGMRLVNKVFLHLDPK